MFKLFMCAVCQVEIKPGEGISIHSGSSSNPEKLRPWDGPFLCTSCQEKREAMEGKRPSGSMTTFPVSYILFMVICFYLVLFSYLNQRENALQLICLMFLADRRDSDSD